MTVITEGTVIRGTFRQQDLAKAFLDELEKHDHAQMVIRLHDFTPESMADDSDPFWETEDAVEAVQRLIDALDKLAPATMYFGAHEGNASDFGFWLATSDMSDDFDPQPHLDALRNAGYAVAVWTPEEVEGVDIGQLEDIVIERGNMFIEDTRDE